MSDSKLTFLGDRGVGKSSFVLLHGNFSCGCEIVQFTVADTEVNGNPLTLHLFDSAGTFLEGEYNRIRPLRYAGTELFVLCFDVANRSSFRNVTTRWIPEVRQYDPEAQILLLGTKTDLRGGKNEYDDMWMVTKTEGEALGAYLGIPYAECSSLLGDGVQEVIDTAIKLSIQILRHSSRKRLFRDKRKT